MTAAIDPLFVKDPWSSGAAKRAGNSSKWRSSWGENWIISQNSPGSKDWKSSDWESNGRQSKDREPASWGEVKREEAEARAQVAREKILKGDLRDRVERKEREEEMKKKEEEIIRERMEEERRIDEAERMKEGKRRQEEEAKERYKEKEFLENVFGPSKEEMKEERRRQGEEAKKKEEEQEPKTEESDIPKEDERRRGEGSKGGSKGGKDGIKLKGEGLHGEGKIRMCWNFTGSSLCTDENCRFEHVRCRFERGGCKKGEFCMYGHTEEAERQAKTKNLNGVLKPRCERLEREGRCEFGDDCKYNHYSLKVRGSFRKRDGRTVICVRDEELRKVKRNIEEDSLIHLDPRRAGELDEIFERVLKGKVRDEEWICAWEAMKKFLGVWKEDLPRSTEEERREAGKELARIIRPITDDKLAEEIERITGEFGILNGRRNDHFFDIKNWDAAKDFISESGIDCEIEVTPIFGREPGERTDRMDRMRAIVESASERGEKEEGARQETETIEIMCDLYDLGQLFIKGKIDDELFSGFEWTTEIGEPLQGREFISGESFFNCGGSMIKSALTVDANIAFLAELALFGKHLEETKEGEGLEGSVDFAISDLLNLLGLRKGAKEEELPDVRESYLYEENFGQFE